MDLESKPNYSYYAPTEDLTSSPFDDCELTKEELQALLDQIKSSHAQVEAGSQLKAELILIECILGGMIHGGFGHGSCVINSEWHRNDLAIIFNARELLSQISNS
jgi:hypothetical protein